MTVHFGSKHEHLLEVGVGFLGVGVKASIGVDRRRPLWNSLYPYLNLARRGVKQVIYDIDDGEFESFVIDHRRACLVEFWATLCGPCKQMLPILAELAQHFESRLDLVRIDIDKNPGTPQRFDVRGIPTLIGFIEGQKVSTKVGSMPASKLIEWCEGFAPREMPIDSSALVALTEVAGRLKLVSLWRDGSYQFLDDSSKLHQGVFLLTLEGAAMAKAAREFEAMINDPRLKEKTFQAFFEEYPNFILNDDYRRAHAHVVLERPTGALIPDFMLEPVNQDRLCDILEIKTPNTQIVRMKKNRARFSDAVRDGIAQLREYQAYFEDGHARRSVEEKYGLVAYRPRLFLVIGRSGTIDPIVMQRVRQDADGVEVQTFDELLRRAQAKYKTHKS